MRSIKNLLVTQCELDKQAHIGFFDTHEDAVKAATDFRRFCSGYPCGLITCAMFEVEIDENTELINSTKRKHRPRTEKEQE